MYNTICIRGKEISVLLHKNSIGIVNNEQLNDLVSDAKGEATDELVAAIKQAYSKLFNTDFKVPDNSMVVEIWGHVYAEKFADAVKAIAPVKFIDSLADKIIYHCEMINIGEKNHDHNRLAWDLLAPLKPAIAAIL